MKLTSHLFLFILTIPLLCQAQESILKFSAKENRQLYFIDVSLDKIENDRIDTIANVFTARWNYKGGFVIDDEESIKKLQASWVMKNDSVFYFCWYDYFVYPIERDSIIDEIRINEHCKQAVCHHGVYFYTDSLTSKLNKSNKISTVELIFESVKLGRAFHKEAKTTTGIYVPEGEYDEWLIHDGKLTISVKSRNFTKTYVDLTRALESQFPHESFKIRNSASGSGYYEFDIYCDETLGKKLKGYSIRTPWESIEPSGITLFSKSSILLEALVKKYSH